MRSISISTDVFAAIWANRGPGEETEEAILRRVLGLRNDAELIQSGLQILADQANSDDRYGVQWEEGFEIFRDYKGRHYRAKRSGGKWLLLTDNTLYTSLHKLSTAVVHGNENAWKNWKFQASDGHEAFIHSLRDISKVAQRTT